MPADDLFTKRHLRREVVAAALGIILVLGVGFFAVHFGFGSTASGRYLGFWMQESNAMSQYPSASSFASMYFGTPPYPASLEIMTFGPYLDSQQGTGSTNTQASINYWSNFAQAAESYPNARIEYMIALDMSSSSQIALFQQEVSALKGYSSIYSFGVEGEYSSSVTLSAMQNIYSIVKATGKPFISYGYGIPVADVPSGAYLIGHTNWPAGDNGCLPSSCDPESNLIGLYTSSPYVGISSGYYAAFSFPATSPTCPVSGSSAYTGSGYGWNQCVVNTEISSALAVSQQYRTFLNLCVGFANKQYNSFQLVDYNNPYGQELRNWIWSAPGYQGNFVLSTSKVTQTSSQLTTSANSQVVTAQSLAGVQPTSSTVGQSLSVKQSLVSSNYEIILAIGAAISISLTVAILVRKEPT